MHGLRVLLAEDEPRLRRMLERALVAQGVDVDAVDDGQAALDALPGAYDAVVLDWNMPRLTGLVVCERLRARGHDMPVLMLTARDAVNDRIQALDAGADDYLLKPFALGEMLARLRAITRRVRPRVVEVLEVGDLVIDEAAHRCTRAGRDVELSRIEWQLLGVLARNADRVCERSKLYEEVWGYDFGSSSNTLEVHIGYLRRKTEEAGEPRLIHTTRGIGYTLRAP